VTIGINNFISNKFWTPVSGLYEISFSGWMKTNTYYKMVYISIDGMTYSTRSDIPGHLCLYLTQPGLTFANGSIVLHIDGTNTIEICAITWDNTTVNQIILNHGSFGCVLLSAD
jgi:hypothetical protein